MSTLTEGEQECQPDSFRGLAQFRERQRMQRSQRRTWTVGVALITVSCALLAAFPVTRVLAERCVDACLAETSQLIWWPKAVPEGGVHTRVQDATSRKAAPDFTLTDATGRPVRLAELRGKVVLLNFWATWCGPCRVETPWFVEFEKAYRGDGLEVLGIALDDGGWQPVRTFMSENQINYRVMLGGDAIARLYGGVESMPTTLVIDRAGRIAATHVGLTAQEVYRTEIEATLAEQ